MAYNPNLYSPYGQPQPYSWSQPIWTNNPQTNSTQPVNGLVSVTGIDGAKAFQLPPNSSVPLFDSNEDILYVKTTDGGGFPTIKTYRFTLMDESSKPAEDYVSRAEFEELERKINNIQIGMKPRNHHSNKKGAANGEQSIPSTTEY